jgi:hypothetical protein
LRKIETLAGLGSYRLFTQAYLCLPDELVLRRESVGQTIYLQTR